MTAVILTWMICEEVTLLTIPWLSLFSTLAIQLKQLYFYSTEKRSSPIETSAVDSKPNALRTNLTALSNCNWIQTSKKAYTEQLQLTINN